MIKRDGDRNKNPCHELVQDGQIDKHTDRQTGIRYATEHDAVQDYHRRPNG